MREITFITEDMTMNDIQKSAIEDRGNVDGLVVDVLKIPGEKLSVEVVVGLAGEKRTVISARVIYDLGIASFRQSYEYH